MSTPSPQSDPATIIRLRKLWCVRINGLNTFNPMAEEEAKEKENGRVPLPEQIPSKWLGCWGIDDHHTFICLKSGDMFVVHGKPNNELLALLAEECPNGSDLQVPYSHKESLWRDELLARMKDPYLAFDAPTNK